MENKTNFETVEDLVEVSVSEESIAAEANEPECEVPQFTTEGNAKGGFLMWLAKKVGQAAGTIIVYELGKKGAKKIIYKGKNWLEARRQAKLAAKQAKLDAESDVIVEVEDEIED
jgi:hypothetical protein